MAPRTTARSLASSSSTPIPTARGPPPIAQAVAGSPSHLVELRRQWKWAAVCQFLYTFAPLIALDDVTVTDIEEDLLNSTMLVLPRLMQRLLLTVTQDRKTNLENWQTILRRQYNKRDPKANPIGFESQTSEQKSRGTTVDSELPFDEGEKVADETGHADNLCEGEIDMQDDSQLQNKSAIVNSASMHVDRTKLEEVCGSVIVEGDVNDQVKDWADLDMLGKLESLHMVMEWHFQNPLRLRGIMRSDDDTASWRIEPIGYDAKHNAYWLIGTDRLWLQRPVPTSPRKRKSRKKPVLLKKAKVAPLSGNVKESSKEHEMGRVSRRSVAAESTLFASPQVSGRVRAAKTQANVMLDLQAKQFLAVKAELRSLNKSKLLKDPQSPSKSAVKQTMGTRVSRRLRGPAIDEEWQQIPKEWLSEANTARCQTDEVRNTRQSPRKGRREEESDKEFVVPKASVLGTGLESGDESELTELSDTEPIHELVGPPVSANEDAKENEDRDSSEEENISENRPPNDFVEWETICVSLEEWESIPIMFETSKHYLEKALYKKLVKEIVPYVTENLREVARLRAKEEALTQRKRSSRLAVRETEREAARIATQQKAEEDERMARTRRQEARTRREEDERLAREQARERRKLEREERELQRAKRQELATKQSEEMKIGVVEKSTQSFESSNSRVVSVNINSASSSKPPRKRSTRKKDAKGEVPPEDWELDCEICGSKGRNKDDGLSLMSCGACSDWQHISCHDADDDLNHRPRRDWDKVDFTCRKCLLRKTSKVTGGTGPGNANVTLHQAPQSNSHNSYASRDNIQFSTKQLVHISDAPRSAPASFYCQHPAPNNANHPSLGQGPSLSHSATSTTFAHYQPQQRGFAPRPTTLQPPPQLHHQAYYSQLHSPHAYQHPPAVSTFHPSLQNGAFASFPGPLQVPTSAQSSVRSSQSSGSPFVPPYRDNYAQVTSGSPSYYQAPRQ